MTELEQKLKQWLNLYWLRPENGLLLTLKSKVFDEVDFKSPSLDISCGDGMFMFLHAGGAFEDDFDYFQATSARQFKHDQFIDIYNAFKESYTPKIKQFPKFQLDCGTDWKQSLLDKADRLKLYRRLVLHDNNIIPFPLQDDEFQTIYSNSLDWTPNSLALMKEVKRLLKPGGLAAIEVSTPLLFTTLTKLEKYLSPEAISILDRNRRNDAIGAKSFEAWRDIFVEAGLKIQDVKVVYQHEAFVDIWNTGLRPISHLLIQMAEQIDPVERKRIKAEWVEIFYQLCRPILQLPATYSVEKAPYLLFILGK